MRVSRCHHLWMGKNYKGVELHNWSPPGKYSMDLEMFHGKFQEKSIVEVADT